jgi:N-acetyl-alpha-D-glucosaminyl L-malate synthase BshA
MAARIADRLQRRGHHVSLISPARPTVPDRELAEVSVDVIGPDDGSGWTTSLDSRWDEQRRARFQRQVERIVRTRAIDVVHYHYAWPFAALVPRLKSRLGAAAPLFVGTLHGTDVSHPPPGTALSVLGHTDLLTTVSHSYAGLARERLGLPDAPVVIPNFVETRDFPRGHDFTDPRACRTRPRLVHVSNFRPVKAPENVGRIFAALRQRVDAELWLIGDGPGLAGLTADLRRAGVGGDVRGFGYRTDVGRLLAQCDLLLMTSREESFCLAALEAMTCGLPVVAPAVGGLTELVDDGNTALLFDPGDDGTAVELVYRLVEDREMRLRMRAAALRRARSFSAASSVQRYEALYRSGLRAEARQAGSGA